MDKMKLAKEQRCILSSQANNMTNMRKALKEIKEDGDVLQEEKKKLDIVIGELLKVVHGSKEKLEKMHTL
ncbi:hypothetical protein D1007_49601 [Hordeum vulgare]|nr:hypothetical protein D1007_49601 [Hordeum vulgare]